MTRRHPVLSLAVTAAVLATGATTAGSAEQIDVVGAKPRIDVQNLCPAIHAELPDALARAWHDIGMAGTVDVLFTVKGGSVDAVETVDGPGRLQRAVRRAVRNSLNCSTSESTPQLVMVRVRFADWPGTATARGAGLVSIVAASR